MSDNSFSHYKKERSSEETEYLYRFCLAKIHICGVDQHKKTLRHLKMITEDLLKSLSLISEAPKSLIYTGTSEILWSVQSWGQKKTISLSPYNVWTYYTGSLDFNAGFLICKKEFDQLISTLSNSQTIWVLYFCYTVPIHFLYFTRSYHFGFYLFVVYQHQWSLDCSHLSHCWFLAYFPHRIHLNLRNSSVSCLLWPRRFLTVSFEIKLSSL